MGKLRKLKEKLQQAKEIREGTNAIVKMRQCPYCNKRREEILQHQKDGHPQ